VTASVNRLGVAAGIYKTPFLAFTVQSFRMSKDHYTQLRISLTRPM